MNGITRLLTSSIGKKYLMAITGTILALFALGHMCGNLQFFLAPEWINNYAHHLQHLPYGLLWVERVVMFCVIVIHVVVGVSLTLHNVQARPGYEVDNTIQATFASRTMIWTGLLFSVFIVFHILHYTSKSVQDFAAIPMFNLEGVGLVPDVHAIMVAGYAICYLIAVAMLGLHLSHGVSSVFQSLGLRNEVWRGRLNTIALLYALVVFCGFASIPLSVLLSKAF
jgi:succinate dehydrogenase / fumarate reductase cytochrome b subunit